VLLGGLIGLAVLLVVLRLLVPVLGGMPTRIDHAAPDLRLHDSRPNQVSSLAEEPDRRVDPLAIGGADAVERVVAAIEAWPRTRVVHREAGYAHCTVRSLLWGFVDDVELQLSADGSRVEIKSASRLGRSDLGVNRARVERLRSELGAR
jgi:uncharacterized protein (DUF1499 family)